MLLLGPSGSGKSTLALALNGLIPQSVPASVTGSVEVAGLDAATTPVARLSTHVGMVFQDPDAQLVTGTVLDEVAFGPENLRLPVDEVLARSEAALRRVGLWERRADNPDRLSGGGRQRLAIACALALGSPLLVLDEPTANLDPRGIEEVYAALAEVVAAGDRSILLIEHNLDAAVGMTDRVVVLDADGRTVADGDVDAVLRERAGAPRPRRVAAGLDARGPAPPPRRLRPRPAAAHARRAACRARGVRVELRAAGCRRPARPRIAYRRHPALGEQAGCRRQSTDHHLASRTDRPRAARRPAAPPRTARRRAGPSTTTRRTSTPCRAPHARRRRASASASSVPVTSTGSAPAGALSPTTSRRTSTHRQTPCGAPSRPTASHPRTAPRRAASR